MKHPLLLLVFAACTPEEHAPEGPRWTQVLAKPCALAADGTLACWSSDSWLDLWHVDAPTSTAALSIQSVQEGILRGLGPDGSSLPLACPERGWDPCPDIGAGLSQVTDYGGVRDGQFVFDPYHDLIEPPDRDWDFFADDRVAAIDTSRRVWFADAPQLALQPVSQPIAFTAHIVGGEAGACVLDNSGFVTCAGSRAMTFDDPPYRLLAGRRGAVCAVKGFDAIVCNDGTTTVVGTPEDPISQLDVTGYAYYDSDDSFVPAGTPSFCAVTEAGTLTCEGPRYPLDLLDQLP